MSTYRAALIAGCIALVTVSPASANMVITLAAGSNLSGGALTAWNQAAAYWDSVFTDNITVSITATMGSLGSGVLGSTSVATVSTTYDTVRNAMVADGSTKSSSAVTDALPTAGGFNYSLPSNFTYSGNIAATQANMKALGFTGYSGADGGITFGNGVSWAYDSASLNSSTYDFQSVALHEIGHVLGFISIVDTVDQNYNTGGTVSVTPLDLFRFNSSTAPVNLSQFTTAARELRPGYGAVTSDGTVQYGMSTGASHGNGYQASHWLNGPYIGVMEPAIATNTVTPATWADLYAFDLIGYDLAVPEPGTLVLVAGGILLFVLRRSRP